MESDFANTIGEDNMEALLAKLGNTDIEQITAWNLLSKTSVEFDDSIKRNYMKIVSDFIRKLNIDSANFKQLLWDITKLKNSADEVAIKRLESHIITYCKKMKYELQSIKIKDEDITLKDKKDGVQLGFVVKVKTNEDKELTYYAKTHSEGTLKSAPSGARSAQPVNYIEPLTYRLLDILGVGPQSHLFGRDERNFYIMTLDIATNPKTMQPLGKFLTFDKINKSEEKENYLGKLINYEYDDEQDKNDAEYVNLINEIENDEKSMKFCYEITKMNLLMRIIYMTDLYSNSGNFGFISNNGQLKEFKIVDMRVWSQNNSTSIKDFKRGNGMFMASNAADSLSYVFKARDVNLRLEDAQEVMNNELKNFEKALKEAYREILPMINEHYKDDAKKQNQKAKY